MNKETLEALKGSIRKWENVVAGTQTGHGGHNCPLCQLFNPAINKSLPLDKNCEGCPVQKAVGQPYCRGTPYKVYSYHANQENAKEELDFLRSLLPSDPGAHNKKFLK